MRYVTLAGRVLYSLIFIAAPVTHFTSGAVGYATQSGVPMAGVRIVDGSGLSMYDRLTAAAVTALLQAAWTDLSIRSAFVAALPIAGVNGTLEDRMRRGPARGHVLAKTGTTDVASALSGFARDRYVFAVLQNGHPVSATWARVAQDRFAQVLAGQ